jgi:hypothetical protein
VALEGSALSRESPSVWRQRLRNLLRFAGVFIADSAQCYFTKMGLQGAIKLDELGPKNLIDEARAMTVLRRCDEDDRGSTRNAGITREIDGATIGRASRVASRPANPYDQVR